MKNFDEKMKNILSKDFDVPMSTQETIKQALNKDYKKIQKENKILKIASLIIVILLVGGISTKAYINFKDVHRDFSHANVKLENFENINMEFIESKDGKAALKLEKLLITDNDLMAIIKIKFNEKVEFESDVVRPLLAYGIFDENKNAYYYFENMISLERSGITDFYKRNGIKYKKDDVFKAQIGDRADLGFTDLTEEYFTLVLSVSTETSKFPISNKLYLELSNVGYLGLLPDKYLTKEIISDEKWLLEIEIPEVLKNRNTVEYKMKDEPDEICLEALTVTNTSTILRLENKELDWIFNPVNGANVSENINENISIVDENGVEYLTKGMSYANGKISGIFDLNIEKLTEKMYLKLYINGEVKKLELIK